MSDPALPRRTGIPPNLMASGLILLSFAGFSAQGILIRSSADLLPALQIVFLRQALALLVFAPVYWRARQGIMRPKRIDLHALRGALGAILNICGFYAFLALPFADVTAIGLSEVLFSTLFAALILREAVGWRRWLATMLGFAGVIVMLGPLQSGVNVFSVVALVAAICGAASGIALRLTAGQDGLETVMFWQSAIMTVLLLPVALIDWQPVAWGDLVVILPMAIVLVASQALFAAAMRIGEASAVAPLHYVRLAVMALLGFWLYGEIPSLQAIIGGLIIVGAAGYTLQRNASRGG